MPLNPLEQDELTTLEAEYREALQRHFEARLEALERQEKLAEAVTRAEAVLLRVRERGTGG